MPNTQTILTIIFCLIDDLVKNQISAPKPGARPELSNSELIALVVYKELAGIESKRQFLRFIRRDLLVSVSKAHWTVSVHQKIKIYILSDRKHTPVST